MRIGLAVILSVLRRTFPLTPISKPRAFDWAARCYRHKHIICSHLHNFGGGRITAEWLPQRQRVDAALPLCQAIRIKRFRSNSEAVSLRSSLLGEVPSRFFRPDAVRRERDCYSLGVGEAFLLCSAVSRLSSLGFSCLSKILSSCADNLELASGWLVVEFVSNMRRM